MTDLVFVTSNKGKVAELGASLGRSWTVVQDGRGYPEIQAATLAEVTDAGASHLLGVIRAPFILEDSGLFVDALNGFPGVYSRYALDTIGAAGIVKLLRRTPARDRGAEFRTDLLYVDADGLRHHFPGACRGRIATAAAGTGGFGFDPIFVPEGEDRTFAQMGRADKNRLSHRGKAVRDLVGFLSETATT